MDLKYIGVGQNENQWHQRTEPTHGCNFEQKGKIRADRMISHQRLVNHVANADKSEEHLCFISTIDAITEEGKTTFTLL
jgi:hypothetical protein